ncbi:hypothetical protein QSJ19_01850 [Gordonia sp. ABSL11-1]|uniref:hypothetical protein n=1 Tax=Gordonia sp. ABSL11-1 TaxID=3053924 RepID=UPI002572B93F|nr:hypothetical protein [Gordonia sp. ABSL11-1]MDL9944344.1 hypothetical protein [Gordonia sp. ABSL11-1]
MTRSRFVEDLAPGDRISVDGMRGVVRTTTRTGDDQRIVEFVHSSDNRREITLASGATVEIL